MVNVTIDKRHAAQSVARGSGLVNLSTPTRVIIPAASDSGWIQYIQLRDCKEKTGPAGRDQRARRWTEVAARGAAAREQ